jgi:hypothetical protein
LSREGYWLKVAWIHDGDVRDWRCMSENEEGKGRGDMEELHGGKYVVTSCYYYTM